MSSPLPLCFILMPFGKKPYLDGRFIDFDMVYKQLIKPAIQEAGLDPIRADEEQTDGIIHKPMFERLILCDYAVADLTNVNANVFYELGVRHAIKPYSTILLFETGTRLPFDVALLRAMPYVLLNNGEIDKLEETRASLAKKLLHAKEAQDKDSPIFQLLNDYPDIQHMKTDVFREQVDYTNKIKDQLVEARRKGLEAVKTIETSLGNLNDDEVGVIVDLFLSYRDVKGYQEMIALYDKMPEHVARTVLIQEQYAFALNRAGQSEKGEKVLLDLLENRGPSSETYGLLGRLYKDRWEAEEKAGNRFEAMGVLDNAINAYLKGFEADFRDAYPGVNAITLMFLKEPPDERIGKLLPVVRYAVEQKIKKGNPDYWDYATLLELAVIEKNIPEANASLGKALAKVRASWEPETTARNLDILASAREKRKEDTEWQVIYKNELLKKANQITSIAS